MNRANPVTTQQQAYWYLRERILGGVIKGGEHVNPAKIADELGISRMPVREAIRQLDTEGLLTIRPKRRWRYGSPSQTWSARCLRIWFICATEWNGFGGRKRNGSSVTTLFTTIFADTASGPGWRRKSRACARPCSLICSSIWRSTMGRRLREAVQRNTSAMDALDAAVREVLRK